VTPAIASRPRG
jgi:uncharacterized protein